MADKLKILLDVTRSFRLLSLILNRKKCSDHIWWSLNARVRPPNVFILLVYFRPLIFLIIVVIGTWSLLSLKPPAFELKSGYAIVWVHTGNILNWRMATNMNYVIFIHFLNRPSENVSHNGKNYKNLFCLVKLFTNQFVSVKLKLDLFHLFYTDK